MRIVHPTTRHLEITMRPSFVKFIAASFGFANAPPVAAAVETVAVEVIEQPAPAE
jgi:hypothetical protein